MESVQELINDIYRVLDLNNEIDLYIYNKLKSIEKRQ
jgi:hypothetical protein